MSEALRTRGWPWGWYYAAAAAGMVAAGVAFAALAFGAVPRPVNNPDNQENDGSTAEAFLFAAVPVSLVLLFSWRQRAGLVVGAVLFGIGFAAGAALWG